MARPSFRSASGSHVGAACTPGGACLPTTPNAQKAIRAGGQRSGRRAPRHPKKSDLWQHWRTRSRTTRADPGDPLHRAGRCVPLSYRERAEPQGDHAMKHAVMLAIGLACIGLPGSIAGIRLGDCHAETYAGEARYGKARHYRRPLEVTIYPRRRRVGGYSFGPSDVVNTYHRNPPPYADVRQTPGGPFDSGFFFDSAIGPHGGNSPYQH